MRGRCRWSDPPIETRRFQVAPSLKINKKTNRLTTNSINFSENRSKPDEKNQKIKSKTLLGFAKLLPGFCGFYELLRVFFSILNTLAKFTEFLLGFTDYYRVSYRPLLFWRLSTF